MQPWEKLDHAASSLKQRSAHPYNDVLNFVSVQRFE
jgi:hypothetical protein